MPDDDSGSDTTTTREASSIADATHEERSAARPDLLPTLKIESDPGVPRAVEARAAGSFDIDKRYAVRRVLGVGGMGEVRLCDDAWIGRDVAMKVVRIGTSGSSLAMRDRFLLEARVQGQLEHPSVVPVYDIGVTASGETFFTMKRIGGHTLEQILEGLHLREPDIVAKYTRRKLLSAVSQICLAVAYAHSRGVVHRDLKPANIMMGDFGEVYVLDWGVAKLAAGPSDEAAPESDPTSAPISRRGNTPPTETGSIIGTPGYLAPEQVQGETITAVTDVYALGLLLFETLAGTPAHSGRTVAALAASSLTHVPAPSAVAPSNDIAPELDAICETATALDPKQRFESARAMHDAIERFLDGERDAERRRELVAAHLRAARESLSQVVEGGPDAERHRADGIRELGRAVALDPSDEGALQTLSEVLAAPTAALPAEAQAELKAVEMRDRSRAARRAGVAYLSWFAFFPVALIMGVKSPPTLYLMLALTAGAVGFSLWIGGSPQRAILRFSRTVIVLNFALVACTSTLFGPLVFTPGFAAASAAVFVISLRANRATRLVIFLLAFASVFVPLLLQLAGILTPSYRFEHDAIVIRSSVVSFPPAITPIAWCAVTLAQLLVPASLLGRATESLVEAEKRNFAHAWRLAQLLPSKRRE